MDEEGVSNMALIPTLKSTKDLFGKLDREAYRTYHAIKSIDKADHFYNFCVTAHSMKDFFFEHNGVKGDSDKKHYRSEWNKDEFLVAASEIANTSKHFALRERTGKPKEAKTKNVRQGEGDFVEVWVENGGVRDEFVKLPDLFVTLGNGNEFPLYEFTSRVTSYWARFLRSESNCVPRQP